MKVREQEVESLHESHVRRKPLSPELHPVRDIQRNTASISSSYGGSVRSSLTQSTRSRSYVQHNLSLESIERRRHATADSDTLQPVSMLLSSPESNVNMLSTRDLLDDNLHGNGSEASPDSVDFNRYISGGLVNPTDRLHHGGAISPSDHHHHGSIFPSDQDENHSARDSLFPTTLTQDSDVTMEDLPSNSLQLQLEMAEELNTTMKVCTHEFSCITF